MKPVTSRAVVTALFVLWLWVMLLVPVLARGLSFNVAWGERFPSNQCNYNDIHSCGTDCPANYGLTWDQVCIF